MVCIRPNLITLSGLCAMLCVFSLGWIYDPTCEGRLPSWAMLVYVDPASLFVSYSSPNVHLRQ